MRTWSDFEQGAVFQTPGLTLTETHVVSFAGLTGDYHPLHTDEQWCRTTPFETRIAHGPLVYSLALGLVSQIRVFTDAVVAFLGADRVRHVRPCPIGTTIRVDVEIVGSRPTSSGAQGVVTARYVVRDENSLELMSADLSFLTHGSSDEEPGAAPTSSGSSVGS